MQTMQAVFMGMAQGISEFLPISSSAHIVFASTIYKILTGGAIQNVGNEEIFFDILIHLSSLFAVIIFFFKDLKEIVKGIFLGLKEKDFKNPELLFGFYILVATIITSIMGLFIKDIAHALTETPLYVSILLLFTGCVLFSCEKFKQKSNEINLKNSILIGLAQGLAIFPGLSRSGLTIGTGVFLGMDRVKAARFSFILSVPIIILASLVYPLLEIDMADISGFNFKAIFLGCLASFITGFLCIKFFMKFIEKFGLKIFAYYCWIIGAVMIFISLKFA